MNSGLRHVSEHRLDDTDREFLVIACGFASTNLFQPLLGCSIIPFDVSGGWNRGLGLRAISNPLSCSLLFCRPPISTLSGTHLPPHVARYFSRLGGLVRHDAVAIVVDRVESTKSVFTTSHAIGVEDDSVPSKMISLVKLRSLSCSASVAGWI